MVCPPFLCRPIALVCPECLVMWAERRESQRTLGTCFRQQVFALPWAQPFVSRSSAHRAPIKR